MTNSEMLNVMEEKRTIDAPTLVACLRIALDALEFYEKYGHRARKAADSINKHLACTLPEICKP